MYIYIHTKMCLYTYTYIHTLIYTHIHVGLVHPDLVCANTHIYK